MIGLLASPAVADDERGLAREHYARGVSLANSGEYEQALSQFRRAYELSPHFAVLYNIAQAERALGRLGPALAAFESYLSQGAEKIPEERRREVERDIDALKSELAAREPAAPPPLATATATPKPAAPPAPVAIPAAPPAAAPAPEPASNGSAQRTAGYALGVLGIGLGTAAIVHWRWNDGRYQDWKSAYDDYASDPDPGARHRLNEQSESIDRASRLTVGLSVGAALSLGTGVVLLLTSGGSKETKMAGTWPCWVGGVGLCSRW